MHYIDLVLCGQLCGQLERYSLLVKRLGAVKFYKGMEKELPQIYTHTLLLIKWSAGCRDCWSRHEDTPG